MNTKAKKQEGKLSGMPMYARIHHLLTSARLQWLTVNESQPITSMDLLHHALSTARIVQLSGNREMVVDWFSNYLIPSLEEVLEWAREVVDEPGRTK